MGRGSVEVTDESPGVAVARLVGEHDILSSDRLATVLRGLLEEGRSVVVDLGETSFLDSGGVRALFAAARAAAAHEQRLVLQVAPGDTVHRVLEVSGLTATLPSARTRAEALTLARGQPAP